MRRTLYLIVVAAMMSMPRQAPAITLNYYLTVNVATDTWTLSASTDSPGGIAAIVVNLKNITSGTSVAPRSPIKGFISGNWDLPVEQLPLPNPAHYQAFSAQYPIDLDSLVYQVGYVPVPDDAFGVQSPFTMIGSAQSIPTVFYVGSFDPDIGLPDFNPQQEVQRGIVYRDVPPPGGYDHPVTPDEINYIPEIVTYSVSIVPEPASCELAAAGLAALVFFALRRP